MDALGRTLVRRALATIGGTERLDLTEVVPGVYSLRMQAGAAVAVRRLVVE